MHPGGVGQDIMSKVGGSDGTEVSFAKQNGEVIRLWLLPFLMSHELCGNLI